MQHIQLAEREWIEIFSIADISCNLSWCWRGWDQVKYCITEISRLSRYNLMTSLTCSRPVALCPLGLITTDSRPGMSNWSAPGCCWSASRGGRREEGGGHPGLSAGHDLSEYCHMLTTLISRPATLAGVYTPTHNKNMKILRGETGGGSGGQFGKFHFSGMTGQFWSFSKINLIRNEVGVEVLFRSNVYYHCKLTRKIFHL